MWLGKKSRDNKRKTLCLWSCDENIIVVFLKSREKVSKMTTGYAVLFICAKKLSLGDGIILEGER